MFLECGRIVAFASAIEHMARNFEGLFLRVPVVVSPSRGSIARPRSSGTRVANRYVVTAAAVNVRDTAPSTPVITSADRLSFTRQRGSNARNMLSGRSWPLPPGCRVTAKVKVSLVRTEREKEGLESVL